MTYILIEHSYANKLNNSTVAEHICMYVYMEEALMRKVHTWINVK
jgi:hypothetical protein